MHHCLSNLVLGKERTTAICTGAMLGLAALRHTLTQPSTSELIGPRCFFSIVLQKEQFPSIILDGEMLVWDPVSERNLPFGTLKTAALGMFYQAARRKQQQLTVRR